MSRTCTIYVTYMNESCVTQLDKAFTAFADTLLQKKGRVRFHRINESFRKEFPQWGEDVLSSQVCLYVQIYLQIQM